MQHYRFGRRVSIVVVILFLTACGKDEEMNPKDVMYCLKHFVQKRDNPMGAINCIEERMSRTQLAVYQQCRVKQSYTRKWVNDVAMARKLYMEAETAVESAEDKEHKEKLLRKFRKAKRHFFNTMRAKAKQIAKFQTGRCRV